MVLTPETHPQLFSEIHPTKNLGLKVAVLPLSSKTKLWWVGVCEHEWEATVASRVNGSGCPYCSGRKVLKGFNDIATTHPDLTSQWVIDKNLLTPYQVSAGSKEKIVWKCVLNHEWVAQVVNRTAQKSGCPYCSGRKVLKGFNDLVSTHPEVAGLWASRNKTSVVDVSAGSNRKAWWVGECGHEWERVVAKQVSGSNCPVCVNRKLVMGVNDMFTTHPELAAKLANTSTPVKLTYNGKARLEWKCVKGHVWNAFPSNILAGQGCPKCVGVVSKPEGLISDFVKNLGFQVENQKKGLLPGKQDVDIFVPEKSLAIEYNGLYWHDENHKPRNYHYDKWLACKEKDIQLIQVWEDDWIRNPGLIQQMLAHKLGVSGEGKVYARDTVPVVLRSGETARFLRSYHIQGYVPGGLYVGLRSKRSGLLVAVMVFSQIKYGVVVLNRFATAFVVPGGFSKLLKFGVGLLEPTQVVTFADNTISQGKLYEVHGFVGDNVLPPDYMYVVGKTRVHKFNYRVKRFKNDPALKFVEGLTEKQLATLNGLTRVWDAGKVKFVKYF